MPRRSFRPLASRMNPCPVRAKPSPPFLWPTETCRKKCPVRSRSCFCRREGFTKVSEELTPLFVEKFLGGISNGLATLSKPPAFVNTWGDSFFAVFDDLDDALSLAVQLRDYFSKGNWEEIGLTEGLQVRISMHAGPVYEEMDPILMRKISSGNTSNQAARIEPIVLPGSVYVSEIMAALISFGHNDFDFESWGIWNWPKITAVIPFTFCNAPDTRINARSVP